MADDEGRLHRAIGWLEKEIESTEARIRLIGGSIGRLELLDRFEKGVLKDLDIAFQKAGVSKDVREGQTALVLNAIKYLRHKASS